MKNIVALRIDANYQRYFVKFEYPDGFCHAKLLEVYTPVFHA